MPSDRASIEALKNMLEEIDLLISTTVPLPESRTSAARDLLRSAMALADDLLKEQRSNPAAIMGHKGGSVTSQRHGPEHFRQMAEKRKTHGGGRPRKQAQ